MFFDIYFHLSIWQDTAIFVVKICHPCVACLVIPEIAKSRSRASLKLVLATQWPCFLVQNYFPAFWVSQPTG